MVRPFERKKYTARDANSWEKTFGVLMTPFEAFAKNSSSSGIVLICCTVVALVLANSPFSEAYQRVLHTPLAISLGTSTLVLSLHHWINDGLMAVFFYLVGLEIKREMIVGELSSIRQALLPIVAAVGGMVAPALLYVLVNRGGAGMPGWGIPMATDIAFAIAALMLLGTRVPASMMTILTALAIVDDLGAVIVIAVFYTADLDWYALFRAFTCFAVMFAMNRMGIRWAWPFVLVAIVAWFFMHFSGVHATIAGVLGAFATPVNSVYRPAEFSRDARKLLDKFDVFRSREKEFLASEHLTGVLHTLHMGIDKARTLLQRFEHGLQKPVYFLIVPVFALANAGVPLNAQDLADVLDHPVTIGVALGLIVGKFVGISAAIFICHGLGVAKLPADLQKKHVLGMAMLAGIGFTMSIFISELAFRGQEELLRHAKTAVLFASLIAGIVGFSFLFFTAKPKEP